MTKYPIFLDLNERLVVIIGGGIVALRKVKALIPTNAKITIIADKIEQELTEFAATTDIELTNTLYSKDHLTGAYLVIAATNDNKLNERIYNDCQDLKILCNVVDQLHLCDFFVPAVIKHGHLQIAISTDGLCPAYAAHLRKKLQTLFTDQHSQFLIELEAIRKQIIEQVPSAGRKAILQKLVNDDSFDRFTKKGCVEWKIYANNIIKNPIA